MTNDNASRDDGAKQVGTIKLTPTWRAVVPLLVAAIQDGTPVGRKAAIEELYSLADFVDDAHKKIDAEMRADTEFHIGMAEAALMQVGLDPADYEISGGTAPSLRATGAAAPMGEAEQRLIEAVDRREAGLFPGEPRDRATVVVPLDDLIALLGGRR